MSLTFSENPATYDKMLAFKLDGSPNSLPMSIGELLKKDWPDFSKRKCSTGKPLAFITSCSANTAALVGSNTQSSRRRMVKGRITLPYSLCL